MGGFVADADKTGDALVGADGEPGIVGQNQFNQHVAGEKFFRDGEFLAFADLDFILGGDEISGI